MVSLWIPSDQEFNSPFTPHFLGGELHLFYGNTHNCWIAIEADSVNISLSLRYIPVCWRWLRCIRLLQSHFTRALIHWCWAASVGNHTSTTPPYKNTVTDRTSKRFFVTFRTHQNGCFKGITVFGRLELTVAFPASRSRRRWIGCLYQTVFLRL